MMIKGRSVLPRYYRRLILYQSTLQETKKLVVLVGINKASEFRIVC